MSKTIKKMAISAYISKITLDANGSLSDFIFNDTTLVVQNWPWMENLQYSSQKTQTEWIQNKSCIYAVYKRFKIQGHIQTESEGVKEGISCKWKSKESWSSNTQIRKNRF